MSRHSSTSDSVMVRGGAKRMMFPCVGFASSPFSFIWTQTSQADRTWSEKKIPYFVRVSWTWGGQTRNFMQHNILTFAMMTVTHPRLINHDGVEQATTADLLDAGATLHGSQAGAKLHSPCRGILGEILVAQDLHRRHCHLACQRVAPVR